MSQWTCRQSRRGRATEDWRATQRTWTDMWSDHAHTMVVDETRPDDPDDPSMYRAYLDWYTPHTRIRLTTKDPPQRPLRAVHEAAIQEGTSICGLSSMYLRRRRIVNSFVFGWRTSNVICFSTSFQSFTTALYICTGSHII